LSADEWPRYLPVGDAALLVEFGDQIDEAVNRRVHALAQVLAQDTVPGLGEAVPTYRSLLVHYNPLRWDYQGVVSLVREQVQRAKVIPLAEPRLVAIPTVYGGEFGPDLEYVAEHSGLSVQEVVCIHCGAVYRVFMMGFTPGFPYLGSVDKAIATPRLATPRTRVPAGSVGIAGLQTGIYPIESPGGWQIIGRTPLTLFDPHQDPPTLLSAGDQVRFVPISEAEFERLSRGH